MLKQEIIRDEYIIEIDSYCKQITKLYKDYNDFFNSIFIDFEKAKDCFESIKNARDQIIDNINKIKKINNTFLTREEIRDFDLVEKRLRSLVLFCR